MATLSLNKLKPKDARTYAQIGSLSKEQVLILSDELVTICLSFYFSIMYMVPTPWKKLSKEVYNKYSKLGYAGAFKDLKDAKPQTIINISRDLI